MEWDHIERKWAAMTRRVRADLPADLNTEKRSPLQPLSSNAQNRYALQRPVAGARQSAQSVVPDPVQPSTPDQVGSTSPR